jgi:hypothetical protein
VRACRPSATSAADPIRRPIVIRYRATVAYRDAFVAGRDIVVNNAPTRPQKATVSLPAYPQAVAGRDREIGAILSLSSRDDPPRTIR